MISIGVYVLCTPFSKARDYKIRFHRDRTIHHHIGAVDLLPFHPLGCCSMDDAANVAKKV